MSVPIVAPIPPSDAAEKDSCTCLGTKTGGNCSCPSCKDDREFGLDDDDVSKIHRRDLESDSGLELIFEIRFVRKTPISALARPRARART